MSERDQTERDEWVQPEPKDHLEELKRVRETLARAAERADA